MGGWNNNPSTTHFVSAYKRLLKHVQLKEGKDGSNCWPIETVAVLHVSSKSVVAQKMDEADVELIISSEHNYSKPLARPVTTLNTFVGDVVEYIAGFVVRKVSVQHGCSDCSEVLFRTTKSGLVRRKDRGGLKSPSADVLKTCRKAEMYIRACATDKIFLTTKRDMHVIRIFREVVSESPAIFSGLDEHVSEQAPLENHKFTLLKLVVKKYVIIRMCWDISLTNSSFVKDGLRSRATKTVLFQHQ